MVAVGSTFVLLLTYALSGSPAVALTSASSCPSPEQLKSALAGAVPDLEVVTTPARPGDLRVELVDLGDRYQISVDGAARELPDAARRCEERARASAVVIALAVQPHEVAAPPP